MATSTAASPALRDPDTPPGGRRSMPSFRRVAGDERCAQAHSSSVSRRLRLPTPTFELWRLTSKQKPNTIGWTGRRSVGGGGQRSSSRHFAGRRRRLATPPPPRDLTPAQLGWGRGGCRSLVRVPRLASPRPRLSHYRRGSSGTATQCTPRELESSGQRRVRDPRWTHSSLGGSSECGAGELSSGLGGVGGAETGPVLQRVSR